ncbi:hypothetical protein FPSE_09589 [Fusarium pseudograminearum CS3096]|uniref:NACHT domain-containing protein n=1 Tax=Fusarium pseudograminearum (strain CS3096) TaxID=1028729 RepID=K3VY86_FUSPC|nr:hypothetical protein FPSE_09589 [Fusarium pseudograminearum CS3096]EKJ70215.1 hypothetical protein FPSE_09589 [Fusarium pseudograminearum CS3096]
MASSPRLSLERSIDQFRRELTDAQLQEISGANRTSINHEIQKIQNELGREKSLCRIGRMSRFLDAMEEVEKLVTIFLNVSEVVAFIWGPVKLVLMLATTWTISVKNIIDAYEEIAIALDNLNVFHNVIRHNEQLKRMLEDYFSDILRFHTSILAVFSKPDWKGMFTFVWRGFRRNVKPIIESLKRKQAMLSDDKLQRHAILKNLQDSDLYAKEQFDQIQSGLDDVISLEELKRQKQEIEQIKSCLERKLNVSLMQIITQLDLPDTVMESSGRWILSNPRFQSWEANKSSEGCVLYLNGCPGAGKSTLARTIIRHLKDNPSRQSSSQPSLVYFFFKHNDADRKSLRSMLCHIITRIINNDDIMMRFAYDKCSAMDYLDLNSLKSLASDCLFSQRNVIIVLDGLDEAKDKEPEQVLKWCLYELLQMAPSRGCHVKLLVCGQEDGRIESLLSSYPQIRLHTEDPHKTDIQEYCKVQASVIGTRFRLTTNDEGELIIKVSEAAKGMFLYAKVVLSNLASMGSRKEYKAELGGNDFPRDLDEAYERILQRVLHAAGPSAQASAKKILGWLVCSQRPLRWREIQSRFCIDVDTGLCDADDVRADNCKQLCSSLVDATDCELFPGVGSEQTITIIHETASKYLIYTNTIDLMEEHIAMSLFCCRYLSSRPFLGIGTNQVRDALQSGYFSFVDYAAAHYKLHIDKAELLNRKTVFDSGLNIATAKNALSDLEKSYQSTGADGTAEMDKVAGFTEEPSKLLAQSIQDNVFDIRAMIHTQWDDLSQNTGFKELEGEIRHKCTKLHCPKFFVGYLSEDLLRQHLTSHERPFRCKDESCFAYVVGYTSEVDLQSHNQNFHNEGSRAKVSFPKTSRAGKYDLISACRSGNLKQVELLHRLDVDISGVLLEKLPLTVAYMAGHGHICKYLVENGVNPFRKFRLRRKARPIDLAIHKKDFNMLEIFLSRYQDITSSENMFSIGTCIEDIFRFYPPGVEILLRLSTREQVEEGSFLIENVMAEKLEFLFDIWKHKLNVSPVDLSLSKHGNDVTPIHTAFRDIFPKLYVEGKFCPDQKSQEYRICQLTVKQNQISLHSALLAKHYPLATFWMDIDTDNLMYIQDYNDNSPLHSFIMESCEKACDTCVLMAKRLIKLDKIGLAQKSNKKGQLPVHIALMRNISPILLQTIVESCIDRNYKDIQGFSPLHYVRSEENLKLLSQQKGVNLFSRNKKGQTYFGTLCDSDEAFDEGFMRVLLDANIGLAWTADQYLQGSTPLHYAMRARRWREGEHPERRGFGPSRAAKFLLNLPEVEQVLRAFLPSPAEDCRQVRKFAVEEKLDHALEVMEKIGFALLPVRLRRVTSQRIEDTTVGRILIVQDNGIYSHKRSTLLIHSLDAIKSSGLGLNQIAQASDKPVSLSHPAPAVPIPTKTWHTYFSYGIGHTEYDTIIGQQNACIRTLRQERKIKSQWFLKPPAAEGMPQLGANFESSTESATFPYPEAFRKVMFPTTSVPQRDEEHGNSRSDLADHEIPRLPEAGMIKKKSFVSTPVFGVSRTTAIEVESRIQPTYVVLGIFPRGALNPKERIVFIDRPEQFFSKLRWATFRIRGMRGTLLSLKHLAAFRLYRCDFNTGAHTRINLDANGVCDLYLLLITYKSWHIPRHISRAWADWIHRTLNDEQLDVLQGEYALELVLDWSITRILIVVLIPVLLSLAIGIWLNAKAWTDLATIQTAWGTASYIVTAGALLAAMLGFLDIADK